MNVVRRSREGAWIEIAGSGIIGTITSGRSREGAWIEILTLAMVPASRVVAPVRERGLK